MIVDCRARIIYWRFFKLNSQPDCVAISIDIAKHGANSYFRFGSEDAGNLDSEINVLLLELYA